MKKSKIKAIIATAGLALTLGFSAVFGGCSAGRNAINGKDLNIYDIYEAVKVETDNPDLTFTDFLREYLSYNPDEIENAVTLQKAINNSLLSSVSVQARFTENGLSVTYSGSGVIIEADRAGGDMTVVTNAHVVYSAKSRADNNGISRNVRLWLYGSESDYEGTFNKNAISARVVAVSKTYDVAILKVENNDLVKASQAKAASWSHAEEVYVGETVYAIGNADGKKMSANVGYISKDSERVEVDLGDSSLYEYTVLRTSAAINSGNSGGGLFNVGGEIVGLVNAKGKTDAAGFGYALPSASTRRVVQNLLDCGAQVSLYKHNFSVNVTDMYSTGLNADGFAEIYEEVSIFAVNLSSPFYGQLRSDDVLKRVKITRGGETVEDVDIMREHNFNDVLLSVREGDRIEITVSRNGSDFTATATASAEDFKLLD